MTGTNTTLVPKLVKFIELITRTALNYPNEAHRPHILDSRKKHGERYRNGGLFIAPIPSATT